MICKKCRKECFESELKNGICSECQKKGKNNMISTIIISVILSVTISLGIDGWANNEVNISDFKIDSFDMETEKTTYTYSETSTYYKGEGTISCKNTCNDYIVLIEEKNTVNDETNYDYIIVHNGKGKFSTYDSSYSGATEKPSYEINVIGYRSFKK